MKWMIASDIHGSAKYCSKLMDAFNTEKPDRLILLGDLLYHGPRNDLPDQYDPKKVIEMLNQIKKSILCVRGNCDTEVDQMVLEFPIMADYAILMLDNRMAFLTHGHHYNLDSLPPLAPGDILIHGHTHVPAWEAFGSNNLYLNPGSVSIPKKDSHRGYIIIGKNAVTWKKLKGEEYHSISL